MKIFFARLKHRLATLPPRVGLAAAAICVLCYALSFGQLLLPLSAAVKGVLWASFYGLAKTFQYTAILILGKEGLVRLKAKLRPAKKG